jgi:hypothetical protein
LLLESLQKKQSINERRFCLKSKSYGSLLKCLICVFIQNKFFFLQFHLAYYRKDGSGSYVRILNFPKTDWCKIIKGIGSIKMFDDIIGFLRSNATELFEICTRSGTFKISNFSYASSQFMSYWPSCDYKVVVGLYDDIDSNIINLNYTGIIARSRE